MVGFFAWPADQPRHATGTSTYPVEPSSPPIFLMAQRLELIIDGSAATGMPFSSFNTESERVEIRSHPSEPIWIRGSLGELQQM